MTTPYTNWLAGMTSNASVMIAPAACETFDIDASARGPALETPMSRRTVRSAVSAGVPVGEDEGDDVRLLTACETKVSRAET